MSNNRGGNAIYQLYPFYAQLPNVLTGLIDSRTLV